MNWKIHILAIVTFLVSVASAQSGVETIASTDLSRKPYTGVSWTWTAFSDIAVRLVVQKDGADFPTAGWGGTLFAGDGSLGCAIPGVARGYNELLFDVGRGLMPTNGRYAVQIIATNTAGRVEEWARGTLTVRANPSAEGMPTNWCLYAQIAAKVAPFIDAEGILTSPENADALWGAVSNRTDALIQAVSPKPDFTTGNETLVETIGAVAPPPADYGTVKERAMSAVQTLRPSTNYTDSVLRSFAATGEVRRATSYGTATRWTDATGCVWEVGLVLGTPVSDTPGAVWLSYEYWPEDDLGKAYMELNGVGWEQYVNLPGGWTSFTFNGEASKSDYTEGTLPYDVTFVRRLEVPVTNLVGRALSTDTTQTTDRSIMLNDPALASARIVPDARPSAYWPNRQRVLRLGDGETVVTADKAEAEYILVPSPDRLLFVDSMTVEGGVTNYTFKTFRQYLNAVSPETLQESLRAYLPVEGGGSVTGDVTVVGDVAVTGALVAPNLVRVVTADIEANGFSVSNGVLRANSGLIVSNGMCRINCARAVIGIGTPRLHIEGVGPAAFNGITFGGAWDSPTFTFRSAITNLIETEVRSQGLVSASNAVEIAAMPLATPGYRLAKTLPQSVTGDAQNGVITLVDNTVNVVGDNMYSAYAVLSVKMRTTESRRLDILFDFTTSVPTFYMDYGTFGFNPEFIGQTDAFSPTAGTPRLVHMRQIGGSDRWIVTYDDLTPWTPPVNYTWEDEP